MGVLFRSFIGVCMQISGKFKGSIDLIWSLSVSPLATRWILFVPTNGNMYIDPSMVNIISPHKYSSFILASAVCDRTGNVKSYYGNLDVITNTIRTFGTFNLDTGTLFDMLLGEKPITGEWEYNLTSISVDSIRSTISNVNKVRGLEYVTIKPKSSLGLETFRRSLGRMKLKTYEEVVANYDTSWMYNSDGTKKKDYQIIHTIEQLEVLKHELATLRPAIYAVDTETTGLNFYAYPRIPEMRSRICGASLSWKQDQGIYIVFENTHISSLDPYETLAWLIPWINKFSVVTHNGLFDGCVFYSYGQLLKVKYDTLLREFDLDSRVVKGENGLKNLTRKYFNHNTLELEDILGEKFNAELVPEIEPRLIELYACADTDYTLQVFFVQSEQLQRLGRQYISEFDASLYEILIPAQYWGTKLNMDLLSLLNSINNKDIETLEGFMHKYLRHTAVTHWATKMIRDSLNDQTYWPTSEEIDLISEDADFTDFINRILQKQTKRGGQLTFSGNDLEHILYHVLEYPVMRINEETGRIATNDEAISDLLSFNSKDSDLEDDPIRFNLDKNILSYVVSTTLKTSSRDKILVDAAKFNSYKYPFAYLLKIWRKLEKFRTSFFNKLLTENDDGWYYTNYSMTAADTARVINPIQTLEGTLKQLAVPFNDDYYMIVFDLSQIEFRVMLGLANNYWKALLASKNLNTLGLDSELESKKLDSLIETLNIPENDYHREGGSIFIGTTPEDMTKDQRSDVKSVHFSVPYGAGIYSIAERKLRGASETQRANILTDTQTLLNSWQKQLYPLYYYLEYVRDIACTPVQDKSLPKLLQLPEVDPEGNKYKDSNGNELMHRQYGIANNPLHRARYFPLQPSSFKSLGTIRRMAGNFPIQSFARDIFFTMIKRIFQSMRKDGLTGTSTQLPKVHFHNFVHDEATLQVHKSIHPYRIYKYLYECIESVSLAGYPKFFMGVSVVDNWYEGKADEYEAIASFMKVKIQEYDANREYYDSMSWDFESPKQFVFKELTEFFENRVISEAKSLDSRTVIDLEALETLFKNYYLKPRLSAYITLDKLNPSITELLSGHTVAKYVVASFVNQEKDCSFKFKDQIFNTSDAKDPSYQEISEYLSEDDTLDVDDFDFSSDISLLSDSDVMSFEVSESVEDAEEREQFAAEFYSKVLEPPTISVNYKVNPDSEDLETDATERLVLFQSKPNTPYLFNATWYISCISSVLSNKHLTTQQKSAMQKVLFKKLSEMFEEFRNYLKDFEDIAYGMPVEVITDYNKPRTSLGIKILPGFSQSTLSNIRQSYTQYFKDFIKQLESLNKPTQTNYF